MARRRPQYMIRRRDRVAAHIRKFRKQLRAGNCDAAVNTYHWMTHEGHHVHVKMGRGGYKGTMASMRDALKRVCGVPHLRGRR